MRSLIKSAGIAAMTIIGFSLYVLLAFFVLITVPWAAPMMFFVAITAVVHWFRGELDGKA